VFVSQYITGRNSSKKTLTTIVNQDYQNIEIIVLDNASADSTAMIVKKFDDPRIKYFKNDNTIKAGDNWTRAVGLARGDFVAIYHADDIYEKNIVSKEVEFLLNNPKVGVVFSEAKKINSVDKEIGAIKVPKNLPAIITFRDLFLQLLRNNYNPLVCPTAMVRKEIYQKTLPYDNANYKYVFDIEMYLRIAEISDVGIIKEPLINYRIHQNQGSLKYLNEQVDHNEFYDMIDRFIAKNDTTLTNSDLDRYDAFKRWDYAVHAIKALTVGNRQKAKELSSKILSLKMIRTCLFYPPLLLRLFIIFCFLLSLTLGFGESFAKIYTKNKMNPFG
jgi:glycosyltransferase involved in cell wall biosynthesis